MSLKKEMLLAIILGTFLGVLAALFITQTPQKLFKKFSSSSSSPKQKKVSPIPSPTKKLSLEILFPQDQDLTQEKIITVSGKTNPKTTVVVTTPFSEDVKIASDDGSFSAEINLQEGVNEIVVVALQNKQKQEKRIIVNYTKEEL